MSDPELTGLPMGAIPGAIAGGFVVCFHCREWEKITEPDRMAQAERLGFEYRRMLPGWAHRKCVHRLRRERRERDRQAQGRLFP